MATQITSDNFNDYFDSRMEQVSAALDNMDQVPDVPTVTQLELTTTMPMVKRDSNGQPIGYEQIKVSDLINQVATQVDPSAVLAASDVIDGAQYNSQNNHIELLHGSTVVAYIDATDIFDAANYYNKTEADAGFADRISTYAGNILAESTVLPPAPDAVWMSQFLDCFSLHQVTKILKKVHEAATDKTLVYVLEPLWDQQRFEAESYALQATSLYFTCMANGNSKMYRYKELVDAIEAGGFELKTAHHNLGSNCYSLLVFRKK